MKLALLVLLICTSAFSARWEKEVITWDAPSEMVRDCKIAFNEWGRATGLKFIQSDEETDIEIFSSSEPAEYGILAFAEWILGDSGELIYSAIVIDPLRVTRKRNFRRTILLHEIGHALGFMHVMESDSIMFPLVYRRQRLSAADRKRARELYGFSAASFLDREKGFQF